MDSQNSIYKRGEYTYKSYERRVGNRAEFNMDIYYPRINDKSVYEIINAKNAVMRTLNISKTGVLIESIVELREGDFINFTIKVEENPSFWCLVKVKRFFVKNSLYYAGCEFISLNMEQINIIKRYVDEY